MTSAINLQLDTTYVKEPIGKNTVKLFFKWLGYSKNGLECFLIWSSINEKKEFITLPSSHIAKLKPLKKTFYSLPLDNFNQPTGTVIPIELTEKQFLNRHPNSYIFRTKEEADRRAQD